MSHSLKYLKLYVVPISYVCISENNVFHEKKNTYNNFRKHFKKHNIFVFNK